MFPPTGLAILAIIAGPLTVSIVLILFAIMAFTGGAVNLVPMDQLVAYGILGAIGTGIYIALAERSGVLN